MSVVRVPQKERATHACRWLHMAGPTLPHWLIWNESCSPWVAGEAERSNSCKKHDFEAWYDFTSLGFVDFCF